MATGCRQGAPAQSTALGREICPTQSTRGSKGSQRQSSRALGGDCLKQDRVAQKLRQHTVKEQEKDHGRGLVEGGPVVPVATAACTGRTAPGRGPH